MIFIKDYNLLVSNGNIGFYNSCEVTEIFLYNPKEKSYYNFYTLISFEEKEINDNLGEKHLFDKLLSLKFKENNEINNDYKLGISQYNLNLNDIKNRFIGLKEDGKWESFKGFHSKDYSNINCLNKKFITSNEGIRLNKILKNNFYNGSYILEFFEEDKSLFNTIFAEDSYFDEICSEIRKVIPINLYSLEERLGNFIFQFPVNMLDVNSNSFNNSINFNFQWHSNVSEVPDCLIEICSILDEDIIGYSIEHYNKSDNQIILIDDIYHVNIKIINNDSNLLLYEYDEGSSSSFNISTAIGNLNYRSFKYDNVIGNVQIFEKDYSSRSKRDYKYYLNNSLNKIEKKLLEKNLSFKFYKQNKEEGLEDLRNLIRKYGRNGVYLWDPFLTPEDIINTLFFSEIANVPLKALGSLNSRVRSVYNSKDLLKDLKEIINDYENQSIDSNLGINKIKEVVESVDEKQNDAKYYISKYKNEFLKIEGNFDYKLNLEFRVQYDSFGYKFHDRLLIFPGNSSTFESPKVFSLGTSVNSFGKNYHILQEVSHPQAIIDEFNKLWEELNHKECVVWKSQR